MYLTINVIDDNILKLSSYLTIIWGRVHHGIAPIVIRIIPLINIIQQIPPFTSA